MRNLNPSRIQPDQSSNFVLLMLDAHGQWRWPDQTGLLFVSSAQMFKRHTVQKTHRKLPWRKTGSGRCLGVMEQNCRRTERKAEEWKEWICTPPQREMKQQVALFYPANLWLNHALSAHLDKASFSDRQMSHEEAIDDFWRQKDYTSSWSHQLSFGGLQ